MGGRLDATNAFQSTTCSVITTISFDHQNILGNSLEEIAREKSGIIKSDSLLFLGFNIKDGPKNVIQHICSQKKCKIYQPTSVETFFNEQTADYQNYNATTAKLVAQTLSQEGLIPIKPDLIEQGIRQFYWPARWQKFVYKGKIIFFDGAHNEEGALAISHQIKNLNEAPVLIFGSNKEARAKKMLKILLPICKKVLISKSTHERALTATQIYSCIEPNYQNDKYVELIDLENISSWLQKSNDH